MRSESLEGLSRELNVPAHRLSEWRDRVLIAVESALKEPKRDARDACR
jgi:transposase